MARPERDDPPAKAGRAPKARRTLKAKIGDRDRRLFRFKRIPARFLLPNIVTLLALCAGVTSIRLGVEGRFELAVAAVIVAIVLDAVDGRLARLLKGTTKFGAELDSLADFVNFGVAPAVLIYIWSLHELGNLGWVVALGLAVCCALRLARFNVALDDPDKPAWMNGYFTGVPAPAGAGLALAPFYLGFLGLIPDGGAAAPAILPFIGLVAVAMVAPIPTYSGKTFGQRVSRELVLPILAGVVIGAVLLIAYTWQMLALAALTYIAMIPLGVRSYRRQKHEWDARSGHTRKLDQEPEGQGGVRPD
jgi:CDP-diacylglycerol---serine O-phosphatidyltransferase